MAGVFCCSVPLQILLQSQTTKTYFMYVMSLKNRSVRHSLNQNESEFFSFFLKAQWARCCSMDISTLYKLSSSSIYIICLSLSLTHLLTFLSLSHSLTHSHSLHCSYALSLILHPFFTIIFFIATHTIQINPAKIMYAKNNKFQYFVCCGVKVMLCYCYCFTWLLLSLLMFKS